MSNNNNSNNNSNTFGTATGISMLSNGISQAQFNSIFDIGDDDMVGTGGGGGGGGAGGWDNLFDGNGDGDEDSDQTSGQTEYSLRDCIIFLIDCSKSMFLPNPSTGEIPFKNAIKCLIQTITDKIITSESDLIGLCLFGTDKNKNLNDFENIYVMSDLDTPDPKLILQIEDILAGDLGSFGGSAKKEFAFGDVLWTCSTMFSNCNVKIAHKRIFLFTNEDNPNQGNDNLRTISFQRAKDLSDLGIEIELFAMNKNEDDDTFDFGKFYQNIIFYQDGEYIDKIDASSKFEALRARLKRKEFKKRSLGKIPFYIGNNPNTVPIACQIYYYGGEPVVFSKEEVEKIKSIDRQGMVLMGFKPANTIKRQQTIKHMSFLFPDEKTVKGSTVTLNALIDKMIELDRVAICKFLPRAGTLPRMVALIAQEEIINPKDSTQIQSRGFNVFYLPYADDIRQFQFNTTTKANEKQIDAAKKIIKTFKINYNDQSFLNPGLQKHYNSLQAIALERDKVEDVKDTILPNEDNFSQNVDVLKDYQKLVFSSDYKVSASSSLSSAASKKRDREGKGIGDYDWVELAQSGGIAKLTIPELSEFLKNQGQKTPSKFKKADLVSLATNFVNGGKIDFTKLSKLKSSDDGNSNSNSSTPTLTSTKSTNSDTAAAGSLYGKHTDEEENKRPTKKVKQPTTSTSTTSTTSTAASSKKNIVSIIDDDDDIMMKPVDPDDSDDDLVFRKTSTSTTTTTTNNNNNNNNDDSTKKSGLSSDSFPSYPASFGDRNGGSFGSADIYSQPSQSQAPSSGSFNIGHPTKPMCKYGAACYRKNADHLKEFNHPKK
ncbi:ATP-dependent DNA helicase [Cavenderia fasciculata]|uniref:DNA helicase n=1 Tax=Cavenderia fasciculata TaxID=261658 RepID=F4PQ85_CACFS|nr:ATP-dependent DNA helicase [Cavenderia fasciculata]EGG22548.1 ATP-dependent DNA helicase [Cavenderia fasciculata]|eukprot:XP_004360399.1 ATP-dependent DNA helicase [Cavenderia fasciculata]